MKGYLYKISSVSSFEDAVKVKEKALLNLKDFNVLIGQKGKSGYSQIYKIIVEFSDKESANNFKNTYVELGLIKQGSFIVMESTLDKIYNTR